MTLRPHLPLLPLLPCLAVLIGGCASAQAAPAPAVDALADVYTAVALTVSGATIASAWTATPAATSTATPITSSPVPSPTPTSGAAYVFALGCNGAAYASDVTVPDGEDMAPGENFTKTWKLLNTGSCTWSKSYSLIFVEGEDMQASSASLDTAVAVGSYGDVSVELTAPEDEGTYTAYWRLADSSGVPFGEQFYVRIVVSGDASTPTPTPTPETPTPTPTVTLSPPNSSPASPIETTATPQPNPTATSEAITSSPSEAVNYVKTIRS